VRRRGPALHVDDVALHLGDDRAHAAKREQRQQREVEPELDQRHSMRLRERYRPTITAIGITTSSGTRPIATAMKQPAINTTAAGLRAIGRPSFTAVAMKRPAPEAPTPVTTADTSGRAAQRVEGSASTSHHRGGSAERP